MLSPEERNEIEAQAAHYPTRRAMTVDALKIVQRHRGYIPDDAIADVAAQLGLPPAELESVATFYSLLFRRPVGRHVVLLCDSVSCWIMGCEALRAALAERCGLRPGETTRRRPLHAAARALPRRVRPGAGGAGRRGPARQSRSGRCRRRARALPMRTR